MVWTNGMIATIIPPIMILTTLLGEMAVKPQAALTGEVAAHRRAFLSTSVSTALTTVGWSPRPASALEGLEAATAGARITVPLRYGRQGQELLLSYRIGNGRFAAVLDTGSPFLTVPGPCGPNASGKYGCFAGEGRPSGLASTYNYYDGFEGGVDWRTGPFRFDDAVVASDAGGDGDGAASSPLFAGGAQETIFGVVDDSILNGPGGVFFGLVKRSDDRIRPSFLGQTSVRSFRIDLLRREAASLTLSDRDMIGPDDDGCVPLTDDLRRRYGDPVGHYVARVDAMLVNGAPLNPDGRNRPIYAIVDTGCTGMVVSPDLFGEALELRRRDGSRRIWGAVEISFRTRGGGTVSLTAERPMTTLFDPESAWGKFRNRGHVVVMGLALLNDSAVTIDVDANRMRIETAA